MLSTNIATVCGRAAMCEEHARPRKCKDLKQMAAVPWRRVEGQLGWLTSRGSDVSIVAQSVPRDCAARWAPHLPGPVPRPARGAATLRGGRRHRASDCIADARLGTACLCNQQASCQPPTPLQVAGVRRAFGQSDKEGDTGQASFPCDRGPKCSGGNRGWPQTLRDVVAMGILGGRGLPPAQLDGSRTSS